MRTLKVKLNQSEYEIKIGANLLGQAAREISVLGFKDKCAIITNPVLEGLYGARLQSELKSAGYAAALITVPEGEQQKSLEWAGRLYDRLCDSQVERQTPVLALGGGVIGDLAGFVAATYLRGLPLVQLPTSLLAMVDSSVGGKVAVDHGRLKNNVGTFYQPRLVLADISTLKTLPPQEMENGLAECIKCAIIQDEHLFTLLENQIAGIKSGDKSLIEELVARCVAIKARIVEQDERDLGPRNVLNFGHTVGHAIESVSNFGIPHGRAVAIGMVTAAIISQKMGYLRGDERTRIQSLIEMAGLSARLPAGISRAAILEAMQYDKKKSARGLRFVLARRIGAVALEDGVSPALVEEALKEQDG